MGAQLQGSFLGLLPGIPVMHCVAQVLCSYAQSGHGFLAGAQATKLEHGLWGILGRGLGDADDCPVCTEGRSREASESTGFRARSRCPSQRDHMS